MSNSVWVVITTFMVLGALIGGSLFGFDSYEDRMSKVCFSGEQKVAFSKYGFTIVCDSSWRFR